MARDGDEKRADGAVAMAVTSAGYEARRVAGYQGALCIETGSLQRAHLA